jgi:hypothetical protein
VRNAAASPVVKRNSAAQLVHLIADTQAGQGERRVLTRGNHQVHLGRQVFKQKREGIVNWPGINQVVVVQHQDNIVWKPDYLIKQSSQD